MKTRLVLFTRLPSSEEDSPGQILFARWGETLLFEMPGTMGVEDFALKYRFKRHSTFDYSVGEMGRKATLLECTDPTLTRLQVGEQRTLKIFWENFRTAALALRDGQDRRYLQLAVQFLASGASIDDSVIAADYDAEFLQQLQDTIASKKDSQKTSE